jgi:hypothetical protein
MIESVTGMHYGRVVSETVYKAGLPVSEKQTTIEIIKTPDRKALLDTIFDQLKRLADEDSIVFEIFAAPHSHEPCRIEVTTKTRLL